jgi:hypothetical protein
MAGVSIPEIDGIVRSKQSFGQAYAPEAWAAKHAPFTYEAHNGSWLIKGRTGHFMFGEYNYWSKAQAESIVERLNQRAALYHMTRP